MTRFGGGIDCVSKVERSAFGPQGVRGSVLKYFLIVSVGSQIFHAVAAKADGYWAGSIPGGGEITGGSGCAVARAQQNMVYGDVCPKGCSFVTSTFVAMNGRASCDAGGTRPGFAFYRCSEGSVYADGGCWDEDDLKRGGKGPPPYCPVGNPIDPVSGVKKEYRIDIKIGTANELSLERYYYSNINGAPDVLQRSRFGYGWRSNFDYKAWYPNSSDTSFGAIAHFVTPTGESLRFNRVDSGPWTPRYYNGQSFADDPSGSKEKLESIGSNLELTDVDGTVRVFNKAGNIIQTRFLNGYVQDLTYDDNGYNTVVADSFGRSLTFTYDNLGQARSVISSTGISLDYVYLERLDPAFIQTYFTGTPADPAVVGPSAGMYEPVLQKVSYTGVSSSTITYLYEDSSHRFGLTGIMDERGIRYATFAYDSKGYAIKTTHINNSDNFDLEYDLVAGKTTVTNPLGKKTIYNFGSDAQNRRQLTRIDGVVSANCPSSAASFQYDNNGYLGQETDEEGRVTQYVRDQRGRPTSITRGAP